jgi:hypothetical protein
MGMASKVSIDGPRDDHSDDEPEGLEASSEGERARLSGTATDLEELGQAAAAAQADPEVESVDVGDVEVEQPDSGLWH